MSNILGWKKYDSYQIEVDPNQNDKATRIRLCHFSRPHMRAFHFSWWSYFMAFVLWFAVTPLLSEIQISIGLSKEEIWTSSIAGVAGTIAMRFLFGPLCDKYGARVLVTIVLIITSIPVACTGLVNSAIGLTILRFFIGIVGSIFVMAQFWTSSMFTKSVVGTANATVGGWGNLGGGVTQLLMGSALFPLFKVIYDGDAEKAWRTVFVIPAFIAFVTGVVVYFYSDDTPKGNYIELKRKGLMPKVSGVTSFRDGAMNINTWLLFVQYACCFGVELTMNNAAALYFRDEYGLKTESAAAIASIFGWMNLFARGMGGFISDWANSRMGMRGRLLTQSIFLAAEGSLVLLFSSASNLGGSIAIMVFFSLFVQAAEGSTYGIVPYVNPPYTGSITGIVGAGGNVGATCFSLAFRQLEYNQAFNLMGSIILSSSVLSLFVFIKGHSGLVFGKEDLVPSEAETSDADGSELSDPEAAQGEHVMEEGDKPVDISTMETKFPDPEAQHVEVTIANSEDDSIEL